jgi:hypothetical protein
MTTQRNVATEEEDAVLSLGTRRLRQVRAARCVTALSAHVTLAWPCCCDGMACWWLTVWEVGRILEAVGRVTKEEVDRCRTEASNYGKTSYAYAWILDQSRHERERGLSTCAHTHHTHTRTHAHTHTHTHTHTAITLTPSHCHLTCCRRHHYTSVRGGGGVGTNSDGMARGGLHAEQRA